MRRAALDGALDWKYWSGGSGKQPLDPQDYTPGMVKAITAIINPAETMPDGPSLDPPLQRNESGNIFLSIPPTRRAFCQNATVVATGRFSCPPDSRDGTNPHSNPKAGNLAALPSAKVPTPEEVKTRRLSPRHGGKVKSCWLARHSRSITRSITTSIGSGCSASRASMSI